MTVDNPRQASTQPPEDRTGEPAPYPGPLRRILIWDGDCGFCGHWVDRLVSPSTGLPSAVAWQQLGPAGLQQVGLGQADVATAAYWIDADGRRFRGHRAVAQALMEAGGRRAWLGRIIELPGLSTVAAAVYWVVARTRRWLPAGDATCQVPGPH